MSDKAKLYDEIDSNLDFEPDEQHKIADMANVGYDLMKALRSCQPDYFYNNSPAEIVCDLSNTIYDKDARIAELEEENTKLHLASVAAEQKLRNEVKKYDAKLEEIERKLAEQQAALFTMRAIVSSGSKLQIRVQIVKLLQKHFDSQHQELNNLLAKAKEEGRREAVPKGWQVVPKVANIDMYDAGTEAIRMYGGETTYYGVNECYNVMLSVAPKPEGMPE